VHCLMFLCVFCEFWYVFLLCVELYMCYFWNSTKISRQMRFLSLLHTWFSFLLVLFLCDSFDACEFHSRLVLLFSRQFSFFQSQTFLFAPRALCCRNFFTLHHSILWRIEFEFEYIVRPSPKKLIVFFKLHHHFIQLGIWASPEGNRMHDRS
jgi:hypothetical protein